MATYSLFTATNGPATVSAASGGWLIGVLASPTGRMMWLNGYRLWVPGNGDTTPRKFATWNRYSTSGQSVVPGSVVTSGTLTAGQWNSVPLGAPVQLAPGGLYVHAAGWTATSGIAVTANQFGSGDPFGAGIVNGPLTAWSGQSGSNAFPSAPTNYNLGQMLFSNSLGSDPSAAMPNNGSSDNNLWMDVILSDTAPAGYAGSYRIWPNQADLGNYSLDTANGFTLGLSLTLGQACALNWGWFYSPSTVTVLPTAIGVYRVSDHALVAVNAAPSWSGAAGSGWVSSPLSGVLPAGQYRYAVFQGSNVIWNAAVAGYYSTGFGANGLTSGPISVPNDASAPAPGQESYHQGATMAWPDTHAGPYRYGLDVEMTPLSGSGLLMASGII